MAKRAAVTLVVLFAWLWIAPHPVHAHTEFASSDPADGAIVDQPVTRIEITFTGEAAPAGDGFEVLAPSGITRLPKTITSTDGQTWILSFDPPLAGGIVGIRWSVAAPDAHPIQGSFSFTAAAGVEAEEPEAERDQAGANRAATEDLATFLDVRGAQAPLLGVIGNLGRVLSLLGAILAVGGIVFAALVLRGSAQEIRSVIFWVRRAAVLLALGALVEAIHQLAVRNGDWATVWPLSSLFEVVVSSFGLAIILRLVGGALMLRAHLDVVQAGRVADPVVAVQTAVGVGAARGSGGGFQAVTGVAGPGADGIYAREGDGAWRVDGDLALVGLGVLATIASYIFDGHTVTEGVRLVTALVDVAHVTAAAIWAGGLVMLVHVIWLRHRRGTETRALQLAVRFSVVAAAALVFAGAAGVALTVIILDSVSELWTTPWGRVLIAKIATVAVAAAGGGYNHKVLIPRMLARSGNDLGADAEFRRTVSVEGAAMLLVIVLTAVLVGSAS